MRCICWTKKSYLEKPATTPVSQDRADTDYEAGTENATAADSGEIAVKLARSAESMEKSFETLVKKTAKSEIAWPSAKAAEVQAKARAALKVPPPLPKKGKGKGKNKGKDSEAAKTWVAKASGARISEPPLKPGMNEWRARLCKASRAPSLEAFELSCAIGKTVASLLAPSDVYKAIKYDEAQVMAGVIAAVSGVITVQASRQASIQPDSTVRFTMSETKRAEEVKKVAAKMSDEEASAIGAKNKVEQSHHELSHQGCRRKLSSIIL